MGKKITQLATITEVADDDLIVGVDVSDTSGSDNGTNKKFTKATLLAGLAPLGPQLTGWNPDAETWVYHNVDDPTGYFKIEGKDVSANYSVGWRIMFTNGGNVIKGIITAITYSDPDTIITFLHEIDPADNQALYLLQNSAITENYVSPHKAPLGFPMSPAKWSVVASDATVREQTNPTQNTWYNLGSFSISIPIGVWNTYFIAQTYNFRATAGALSAWVSLSTANNSASTAAHTVRSYNAADTGLMDALYNSFVISVASKTTYYLVEKTDQTGVTSLTLNPGNETSRIVATCAYL